MREPTPFEVSVADADNIDHNSRADYRDSEKEN